MKFEIKNRYTDAVIYTWETDEEVTGLTYGEKLGRAVQEAIKARANLVGANLVGANLTRANLVGANLTRANLVGANLTRANLVGANNAELVIARTRILPEGDIIGWKKCKANVIVKLRIPAEAKRSHAFGRKCRAEYADVLEVFGADEGMTNNHGPKTVYRQGERVIPDSFCEDWQNECSNGIHFFITREEAEAYV